ncbi:putative iron-regulated membrane protein [Bernardetia litoralis DSM 6794]|uniref:Putative iron-regulated membrane protein n=1 Tax=Bernardetia litoralis (strain ATCC 23117 / DSM 6794 / NBRC 15988 / NCIMB 1366 / Fx l1 / Sio-4) TaxID=880071 RepID=I4AQ92_BERLS|nr:PepSY-associated TM helix domain-containing protein [Bernardetia litoralis]AFM06127.1 putative iron-regulated membrane protein [Bernardetia litoralis DSM 6794]
MNKILKIFLRKQRKKESLFKYIMAVLHLWLGLLSSIIIFIVCLSGSIYAFKTQIENFVDSDIVYIKSEEKGAKISVDTILNNFENQFGGATNITVFKETDKSILVSSFSKENKGVSAYYNPVSGQLLGTKNKNSIAFFDFILEVHRFLLAGDIGKFVNGVAVLIFIFLLFSGFIIWLPKKINQLKKSLKINFNAKFHRINYDLHRVLGFYSILLLFFISITGLYVSFHWVKNAVIIGLGGDSIVISDTNIALKKSLSNSFDVLFDDLSAKENMIIKQESDLQTLLLKTDSILKYDGTKVIQLASENSKSINITKINNDNLLHFYVPDKIEFSIDGKVRIQELFTNLPLHEQFKLIAKPLHTGEIMGFPTITIYFLISLIGCSLPITGFIIWYKTLKKLKKYK